MMPYQLTPSVMEGSEAVILHAMPIHVDYEIDGLHSIEVIDASELHQIIKFAQPVALPEPVKIKPA